MDINALPSPFTSIGTAVPKSRECAFPVTDRLHIIATTMRHVLLEMMPLPPGDVHLITPYHARCYFSQLPRPRYVTLLAGTGHPTVPTDEPDFVEEVLTFCDLIKKAHADLDTAK